MPEITREDAPSPTVHRVSWFAPDRGVEGTVYVRPVSADALSSEQPATEDADA